MPMEPIDRPGSARSGQNRMICVDWTGAPLSRQIYMIISTTRTIWDTGIRKQYVHSKFTCAERIALRDCPQGLSRNGPEEERHVAAYNQSPQMREHVGPTCGSSCERLPTAHRTLLAHNPPNKLQSMSTAARNAAPQSNSHRPRSVPSAE